MSVNALSKLPPHSVEAEQSILGSMILSSRAAYSVLERLTSEDFYVKKHSKIFAAMVELIMEEKPIDLVTLSDRLDKMKILSGAEDLKYISDLTQIVPSISNVEHYIDIVEEKSVLRRLISAADGIIKDAYDDSEEAVDVLNRAGGSIYDIATKKSHDSLKHVKEALVESYNQIGRAAESKDGILGVPTGFPRLDNKLSGLQGSQMVVIAGRPGMGKTSFALDIVRNISMKKKLPAAVFSLEMSSAQLGTRLMCSEAGINMQDIRSGKLSENDFKRLISSIEKFSSSPLYIDDTPGITVVEILAKARKLKMDKGLGVIMIDYLQLMSSNSRTENRQLEISEITRSVKLVARELDVPILLLSQLSRASEKRDGKIPMLSDLRESGSIEQDADVVIFLHRDNYYDEEADNSCKVIIAKQRMGPTGIIKMQWIGENTRFLELDEQHQEF
ncbi:MAG: replicative DNA helicase [Eubacteriales bacterium]